MKTFFIFNLTQKPKLFIFENDFHFLTVFIQINFRQEGLERTMSPHWTDLTTRHIDERDCLATFVAWQAAEVLAGTKPANLINVLDKELACGRNIFGLWQKHSAELFQKSSYQAVVLKKKSDRSLVLIFDPMALELNLRNEEIQQTLASLGYQSPRLKEMISHLRTRMLGDDFPHEIGFFLGYPIKDVLGFMGISNLPLVGNVYWKMFGELEPSMKVLNEHIKGRSRVLQLLNAGTKALSLLNQPVTVHQKAA